MEDGGKRVLGGGEEEVARFAETLDDDKSYFA